VALAPRPVFVRRHALAGAAWGGQVSVVAWLRDDDPTSLSSRDLALVRARDSYVAGWSSLEDFEDRVSGILADDWYPTKHVDDALKAMWTRYEKPWKSR
jgi:hypothetical protein